MVLFMVRYDLCNCRTVGTNGSSDMLVACLARLFTAGKASGARLDTVRTSSSICTLESEISGSLAFGVLALGPSG